MTIVEARCDRCVFWTFVTCIRYPHVSPPKHFDDWCGEFRPLPKHCGTKTVTKWPTDRDHDA